MKRNRICSAANSTCSTKLHLPWNQSNRGTTPTLLAQRSPRRAVAVGSSASRTPLDCDIGCASRHASQAVAGSGPPRSDGTRSAISPAVPTLCRDRSGRKASGSGRLWPQGGWTTWSRLWDPKASQRARCHASPPTSTRWSQGPARPGAGAERRVRRGLFEGAGRPRLDEASDLHPWPSRPRATRDDGRRRGCDIMRAEQDGGELGGSCGRVWHSYSDHHSPN